MATLTLSMQSIAPNSIVPLNIAQGPITIAWPDDPSKLYTIMIIDLDAPTPENPTKSPLLHYLATNIPGDDIGYGDILMSYIPPNPPVGSNPHRYQVDVYEQLSRYDAPPIQERAKFPVDAFVRKNRLRPYAQIIFLTSKPVGSNGYDEADPVTEAPTEADQRKYCDCRLDVAEKEPLACLQEKAWFQRREGYRCGNPYAICGRLPKISNECSSYYEYDKMTDEALIALATLDNKEIPSPYDREELIHRLKYGKR